MPKEPALVEQIKEKINMVRVRRYISGGQALILTSYFHVPKGESKIRIVYNMTAWGLNFAFWVPPFWMPNVHNVLDCGTHVSRFSDVDVGEILLNYLLDRDIRTFAGVDLMDTR